MSRNIRTFRDLGGDDGGDSDDSGADAERGQPQTFYAGSGQVVQGPPRAAPQDDHIRRILQAAEHVTPDQLGQNQGNGEIVTLTLHLWTDGLSVEDGPLMSRDDAATIRFLEEVSQGSIPEVMARQYPGKQVDFNLNRHNQAYVAPKKKPFSGNGVRLGSVVPSVVTGESSSSSAAAAAPKADTSAEEAQKLLETAKKELNTDMSQPTTNIQIRLPNNQRLVAVFNHTHTVDSVRSFVCTASPDMIFSPFQLMCAYPPKVLEDESVTLKDANLLNSVIAVKISPSA